MRLLRLGALVLALSCGGGRSTGREGEGPTTGLPADAPGTGPAGPSGALGGAGGSGVAVAGATGMAGGSAMPVAPNPAAVPGAPASDLPPFIGKITDGDFTGSLTVALAGGIVPPAIAPDKAGLYLYYDGRGDAADGDSMLLHLRATRGVWEATTSGFAKRYNLRVHSGVVEQPKVAGGTLTARVRLSLSGDGFASAAEATYDLQITQSGNALEGAFSGAFAGAAVKGKISGYAGPRWPLLRAAKPLAKNEHPRTLFRRDDLPLLRQRLSTQQGQQLVARLRKLHELDVNLQFGWGAGVYETKGPPYAEGSWAIGHCFLYQLTGDKAEAERGRAVEEYTITKNDGEWLKWGMSLRRHDAALAYDLCYDAWDPAFRKRVSDFLLQDAWRGRTVDASVDLIFAIADGASALALAGDDEDAGAKAAARLEQAQAILRWFLLTSMGERGLVGETNNYTDVLHVLLPFAHALKTALGQDIAAGTGLPWQVPLVIHGGSSLLRNDWSVDSWWRVMGFAGQVPDAYRPVIRWAMDQHPELGARLPSHAVFAYLTYPFDVPARSPREAGLPLALEDRRMGAFVLRSGWEPTDVRSIFQLRSNSLRSSGTAGDLLIAGGGHKEQLTGQRQVGGGYYVLPRLPSFGPDDKGATTMLNGGVNPSGPRVEGALPVGGARVTYTAIGRDGSAIVSASYDRWVNGTSWSDNNHPTIGQHAYRHMYERLPADLGVRVLQSLAVDHSKSSGAPALYALAYRMLGAPDRTKAVHLSFGVWNDAFPVVEGNRFRVYGTADRKPDPKSLIFDAVVLGAEPPRITVWRAYGSPNLVRIEGASELLIVMTLAPPSTMAASAPAMQTMGSGLGGRVSVGGQEVSFDGQKVVLKVAPTP